MRLTAGEAKYITALAREQAQAGCRGPAHDLLRQHAYPDAPRIGKRSLAFSYEVTPLIDLILKDRRDLQDLDDFLRNGELSPDPVWPWNSEEEFRTRLEQARTESARWIAESHQPRPQPLSLV